MNNIWSKLMPLVGALNFGLWFESWNAAGFMIIILVMLGEKQK